MIITIINNWSNNKYSIYYSFIISDQMIIMQCHLFVCLFMIKYKLSDCINCKQGQKNIYLIEMMMIIIIFVQNN